MRKLTYFVAATLDGYIAGPNGELDFFPYQDEDIQTIAADYPETLPVPVRGALGVADAPSRHFDTVIMGRGTYDPGLEAGLTSPYAHLRQYVVSTTLTSPDPDVEVVGGDPVALVRDLKKQDGQDIWLAGGGKLAGALLGEIEKLIVKRHRIVAGSGTPMFAGHFAPAAFTPTDTRTLASGLEFITYSRTGGRI
ncbi:dihydrofolate reductase [Streptomyces sp. A7024]|uniref:Dihydrofolate reductase n=1 Tax=Streptomyces coryli TaxID=1128680 RepID=A0A6G4U567_9ACTN|nr:dihydrofolate reductase family protein [Streptomyces coryli]NGN66351.1 dihydrofolate reductase [Streptomyces coryli]